MVGEYVLSSAHNSSFTLKFAISFCPSYFTAQEISVTPIIFATRHVFILMDSHMVQVLLLKLEEFK